MTTTQTGAALAHADLPQSVDVAIIGGGIIGCASAYYLAKRKVSVAVCEKGYVACEQSSRNWGFVRQQGRDVAEVPTIIESLRLWRGIEREIGEPVGFHQGGVLYLADSDEAMAAHEAWLEIAKQHQLDTCLVSSVELERLLPGATKQWRGALRTPSDGRAEPRLAVPAIARAARRLGAHVLPQCAVRGLDIEGGRVAGIVTEHGLIRARAVVCAAGAWSRLFNGNLGITLPQLHIRSSVFRTSPLPKVTDGAVWSSQVAFRRRLDEGYTVAHGAASEYPVTPSTFRFLRAFIPAYKLERKRLRLRIDKSFFEEMVTEKRWGMGSPTVFEEQRVLDPAPSRRIVDEALRHLRALFPMLGGVDVLEQWAGIIDVTPDAIPVISPVDGLEGYYLATGFSGHGFGIGLGAGMLVSEMVTDRACSVDIAPFDYARFAKRPLAAPATGS